MYALCKMADYKYSPCYFLLPNEVTSVTFLTALLSNQLSNCVNFKVMKLLVNNPSSKLNKFVGMNQCF